MLQNIRPGHILVITYTNKAAEELRNRLEAMGLPKVLHTEGGLPLNLCCLFYILDIDGKGTASCCAGGALALNLCCLI